MRKRIDPPPTLQTALPALFCLALAMGGGARAQAPPGEPPPSTLPVRQVTLFTSGVAYTERSGMVDGSASVPLLFHTAQINDILKSMVLIDHGGHVQPATYASRDPISRRLESFAVDVSQDLSEAQLLEKLRGADVEIESATDKPVTGRIVGVQTRDTTTDAKSHSTETLIDLLTDSGIRAVRLDSGTTVHILDNRLNDELHQALTTLAGGMDNQRRQVTLHFAGQGRREVRVAYVMEAPIWKISYRLVLGDAGASKTKPYLQGWAMVENTTDEDWKGVRLSLVSGRPVSFIQDLYQPLYIERPEVGPDVVASPLPQTHDENLLASERKPGGAFANGVLPNGTEANDLTKPAYNSAQSLRYGRDKDSAYSTTIVDLDLNNASLYYGLKQLFSNIPVNFTIDESAKAFTVTVHLRRVPFRAALERVLTSSGSAFTYKVENGIYSVVPKVEDAAPETALADSPALGTIPAKTPAASAAVMRESVRSQASGGRAGEMFKYSITSPVSLPRQQAAMIPVIAQDVAAERLSIYNAGEDGRYAVNAIRLHNATPLHLKGGPVTVFDGGTYAGDAMLEDVPPGDTRLISYAVDLSLVCNARSGSADAQRRTRTISIHRGVITEFGKQTNETVYEVRSRANRPKSLLIEHGYDPDEHLVEPARAAERTPTVYRFAVSVPAGQTRTLKVVTEGGYSTAVRIEEVSDEGLIAYMGSGSLSARLKTALQTVVLKRRHLDNLKSQLAATTAQIGSIGADQDRIRKNMSALDKSASLYKRYVSELDAQETTIGAIRKHESQLRSDASLADRQLKAFEDGISG